MGERGEVVELELGSMDVFEETWFEALKCLSIKKISEMTGEPCRIATGIGCNVDEAIHVVTASGRLFHVGYSDVTAVFAIEEVQCPVCGDFVPTDILEEHKELLCGGE